MEQSSTFPIRLVSNEGKAAYSILDQRYIQMAKLQQRKGVSNAYPPKEVCELDLQVGSSLPQDRSLTIEEFTGDISRYYPGGAIYFTLDVVIDATQPLPHLIDWAMVRKDSSSLATVRLIFYVLVVHIFRCSNHF